MATSYGFNIEGLASVGIQAVEEGRTVSVENGDITVHAALENTAALESTGVVPTPAPLPGADM